MKTVWRIYCRELADQLHAIGREFGMDFPSIADARIAKAFYAKIWGDRYYIRAVKVPE